ncbi:MAG: UDP-N-acetylmuramoyl-tripeptide--D-alanyl-D-alanine ligase [Geodermatophilaceae bacterium]|nr:UDP-N-acetylmuramoyl-tripeptide--D-alanyl-D-alanine ligase [Geodermatophilaceae bacterium]
MIECTVADLVSLAGGRWSPGARGTAGSLDPAAIPIVGEVQIDSRSCAPGDLFVALPGERADGHDFAAAAYRAGAVVVLGSRPIPDVPSVVVADPLAALGRLATGILARLPELVVVCVTGSSGKTSTKDLIGELLARWGPTVSPLGSYNNDLGVPLTVLRVNERTRYLVLEMGARGVGHISRLTVIARPAIGLVLNIGTAHLGEFGNAETVARAKSELIAALPSAEEGGVAILNADDPATSYLAGRTSAQVWTFGAGPDADVRYDAVDVSAGGRPRFRLSAGGHQIEVALQLVGAHQAANASAAAAVALATVARIQPPAQVQAAATPALLTDIGRGLDAARLRSRWRMELTDRPDGVSILNDAYNANPESMRAALEALVGVAGGRRRTWAVLGAMGELGDISRAEHEAIGIEVRQRGIDRLVAVGADARGIYAGAAGEPADEEGFIHVPDIGSALQVLGSQLRAGDVVLVKASRYVGLESLADALLVGSEPT